MGLALALTSASLALWPPGDEDDDNDTFLAWRRPDSALADEELLFSPNQEKGMIDRLISCIGLLKVAE